VFQDSVTDDRQSSSGIWEVNLITLVILDKTLYSALHQRYMQQYILRIPNCRHKSVSICILEQTGTAWIWMTDKSELNTLHRIHRSIILYYIFSIFNSKMSHWLDHGNPRLQFVVGAWLHTLLRLHSTEVDSRECLEGTTSSCWSLWQLSFLYQWQHSSAVVTIQFQDVCVIQAEE